MVSKIGTGERLRLIRGYQSQTDFAARIGINHLDYARFESEERSPELDLLIRLKCTTGCSLDWLASGQSPEDAPAIDADALAGIIRSIESETPKLDPETKAKLVLRLYEEFRKCEERNEQGGI